MTTTKNNHLTLIDQVGGIEKAREIVEGAPDNTQVIIPCSDGVMYFSKRKDGKWFRYSDAYQKWLEYFGSCDPMDLAFNLNNLRTAIAQYDKLSCNYGELKAGRRLDHSENVTDMVTDITNHISPNTKVVEL